MKKDLQAKVKSATYHEVVFFQLRSLSLPNAFETEIQNTEVKGQDINTAKAEKIRDKVQFDTNVLVAQLAVNSTLETAFGNANKTVLEARAIESTVKSVVKKQSESFADMKRSLSFGNGDILKYLKTSLIKDYEDAKMIIQLK